MEKITLKIKRSFSSTTTWIKANKKEFILLSLILALAAFMRLYKISEYMTFLGDEGRDVIIVRRLLVHGDPILIGPGMSIGNMYLGPLYYYLMAPALFLANYSPVGPAVQIALIGTLTVFLVWKVMKEWFKGSGREALFAAYLYTISQTVVSLSRFSWNPNIMPFFALLSIYSIWKVYSNNNFKWLLVLGVSLAFILQSHYLGILIFAPILFLWVLALIKQEKNQKSRYLKYSFLSLGLFFFLMSPLVIFDIRHNFINFYALRDFVFGSQDSVSLSISSLINNLWPTYKTIVDRLLIGNSLLMEGFFALQILIGVVVFYKKIKENKAYLLLLVWIITGVLGLTLYQQTLHDHYFGFLFPAVFILLGALFYFFKYKYYREATTLFLLFLISLTAISYQNSPYKYPPGNQLQRTARVAEKIQAEANGKKLNLAVLAERNYEGAYQYFLEKNNAPIVMIDPQRYQETVADQLFVVCEMEEQKCDPTNNPKTEIANFGWSEIAGQWKIDNVILFKLVPTKP